MTPQRLRLALDQNFPTPLINAIRDYLPDDIDLAHLPSIDPRLSDLSDRQLVIALAQLHFDGLVTNNYKMLNVPEEIAAVIKTKSVVVAVEALGHDPIRAVGALLLELPGLASRVRPEMGNVFRLNYARRQPQDAWEYLKAAAGRLGQQPNEVWDQVKVSDQELAQQILT